MSAEDYEIVRTEQGALALRCMRTGEVMHPGAGALAEAQQLYVEPAQLARRLAQPVPEPLVLLDVGLGAGTNAALALRAALRCPGPRRALHVVSFDCTLDAFAVAQRSASPHAFGYAGELLEMARDALQLGKAAVEGASWELCVGDARETLPRLVDGSADVVFWDPFSPRVDPSLWSVTLFAHLQKKLRAGASVHTYSAATTTRAALLLAGFFVGRGPSSTSKQKRTTLASTSFADLADPLTSAWLDGLRHSPSALPADARPEAMTQLAEHPQWRLARLGRDRSPHA